MWDFNVYRFLCGLGVGGQFGIGVALVAEVVPARARPYALGMVQASSSVGNMIAAAIGIFIGQLETVGSITGAWRWEFLAGALPAPLALVVFKKLKEPEQWLKARSQREKLGSFRELFSDPRWRRNSIVGFLLGFAGIVGLWGIGFFSYDLFRPVLEKTFRAQGFTGAALAGKTTTWIGATSLLQNLGAFFGIYAFTYLTHYIGRRKAFAISFLAAMGMTAYTFWNLREISQIFWMIPLMGFTQLALFGGYAIYLAGALPHPAAQHRHQLLLQRGPFRRRRRAVHPGLSDQRRLRPQARAYALRRRLHVPGVPRRAGRCSLRSRNQGPAAAGMSELFMQRGAPEETRSKLFTLRVPSAFSAPPCCIEAFLHAA